MKLRGASPVGEKGAAPDPTFPVAPGLGGERAIDSSRRGVLCGALSVVALGMAGCWRSERGETPESEGGQLAAVSGLGSPAGSTKLVVSTADSIPTAVPIEPSSAPSRATKAIYLQPFGEPSSEADLAFVETALRVYFPFRIERLAALPLPEDAYYVPRQRYRAERLLEHLQRSTPDDAQVVVGLTEVDISTTKGDVYDWGILGLATLSSKQCVISRFRARRGASSSVHVRERLAKTVVHEVGHTIGLEHCPNYGCIMEDGRGRVETTDHEHDVCADCRAKVGDLMLPVPTQLPWS